jgi:hypothetical protein
VDTTQPSPLHFEQSTVLLLSQPSGSYASVGLQAGLWNPGNKLGEPMVGFTPAVADLDHDGHRDIVTHQRRREESAEQPCDRAPVNGGGT